MVEHDYQPEFAALIAQELSTEYTAERKLRVLQWLRPAIHQYW